METLLCCIWLGAVGRLAQCLFVQFFISYMMRKVLLTLSGLSYLKVASLAAKGYEYYACYQLGRYS